jgi:hypothetical protein
VKFVASAWLWARFFDTVEVTLADTLGFPASDSMTLFDVSQDATIDDLDHAK